MSDPDIVTQTETSTAVIHGVVAMAELTSFFDRAFTELATVLGKQGIVPAGPAFARYAGPPGETVELEVGFPVGDSLSAEGRVRSSTLPGGTAARMVHAGSYDQLADAWGRLGAWITEQGLTPGTDLWEVYVTEPSPDMDPADLRTELVWTVR
jgi:effector-binding domain-containing protein